MPQWEVAGWPLTEITRLKALFVQRYGTEVMPSQVVDLSQPPIRLQDEEVLNPPGPRFPMNFDKPIGIIPLHDRVIIRRLKEREKTKSGLYIAETAQEKPYYGVTLEAGDDVRNPYLRRHVIVSFGKYSGTEMTFNAESLLMVREDEITGIVTDPSLVDELLEEGA